MSTRTRSATRSDAATGTLTEAAMDRALGDPLIVRHVLLQAAVGDARRVGRLAKAGRMFWQGSKGAQAQDEELYLAIAESLGWGPGSQRVEAMLARLINTTGVQRCKILLICPLDTAAKAKSVVRALGVNWAVHVHSIETVGGMGDEFYGEQWLNPVSRPKFVHATDAAQVRLPANKAPGGRLGLVLFPNPSGALLFNLYIPHLFKNPISLHDRPSDGEDSPNDPCPALNILPIVILLQLAHVALDASEFGPHLLKPEGQLMNDDTAFLKPLAKPPLGRLAPFGGLVAFSTSIDADKGVRVLKVEGRDNWTKEDAEEQAKADRQA